MGVTEVIKTRLTLEDKARVASVTRAELLSESIWLRRLVLRELQVAQSEYVARDVLATRGRCSTQIGAASRLNVRLRTEDRLLLHERAAARGMASATYISVLVRSHLRSLAPLPKEELVAVKRAVGELGAIGRNLNQIARAVNEGTRVAAIGRDEFRAILKICEALRDHIKNLIKTNTASWAAGHADPQD
jgi:Bacterial mobilisation protein (MobC)